MLLTLLLSSAAGCGPEAPSDETMEALFLRNRAEYLKLVEMSNEDRHVVVIKGSFTYLDTDYSWPRPNIGFSEARWDEYRAIFRRLDVEGGLSRPRDYPEAVFVAVYGWGGPLASVEKGFAYSRKPLTPIVRSLDVYPSESRQGSGHGIGFKALADDWYMYREDY